MTFLEVEHNQLKQLCELALSKIDELSESAAKVEFGEKNFGTLKSDLRVAVMAAGAYYARIAAAQVSKKEGRIGFSKARVKFCLNLLSGTVLRYSTEFVEMRGQL